ncbi:MAG TPA: hypothetical protein VFC14_03055 [Burkholderiales bacterium]|nr:hypothetical protein [Burkholderiales bacterium]
MPDLPMSLRHPETPGPEDTALAQESRSHVAGNAALQLIAELVSKLRGSRFSWWTPDLLRGTWDATERMGWFAQRPDIRQRITCSLTGLKPKAARNKQPDFQAALIDSVIDAGDVTVDQFENEFDAIELAAYAPVADIWTGFRERMPWDQDVPPNQELVAWLIDRLLASSSTIEGMTRKPLLTPHEIRTTIPGKIWHSRIPLEVRVAIDEARFQREREKPGEPYHAIHDLELATPAIIAANIPLRDLLCVFEVAEKAMGLPPSRSATAPAARVAKSPAAATPPRVAEIPAAASPPAPTAPAQPVKVAEVAKAEPSKADVRTPTAPAPVEKAPEKPGEKTADRTMDRWERMASKVLERAGKEKESGGPEETFGKDR